MTSRSRRYPPRPTAVRTDGTDLAGPVGASAAGEVAGTAEERVIPVVAEELDIEIHRVVRGTVHVNKRVETHEEVVNIPAVTEEVVVERLPVNTVVEGDPPQIREEGGVLLIPVLEEVVVVEKRLMLREVVRVTRRQIATTTSETVTLRREVVDVDRVEGEGRSHEKGFGVPDSKESKEKYP